MKKLYTTITILCLSAAMVSAQHLDVRVYGGMNVIQLTSDQGHSLIDDIVHQRTVNGRPGIQAGAAITFGSRFYVQPGIQYTVATTEIVNENTVTGEKITDETKLSLFSIPLKVGFRIIDPETEDKINVRVFGGFDGHHVMSVDHGTNSGAEGDITEDNYSNLIVNADFGMGVDILFLFLDMGYQMGLTPIHTGGDNAKANSFYTNLGLRLKL